MDLNKIIEAQKMLINKLDENKKEALNILKEMELIQGNLDEKLTIKKRINEDLIIRVGSKLKTIRMVGSEFKLFEKHGDKLKLITKFSSFQNHKNEETHWFTLRENAIEKSDGAIFTLLTDNLDFIHIVLNKTEFKNLINQFNIMPDGRVNIGFNMKNSNEVYSSKGYINFSSNINDFSKFE